MKRNKNSTYSKTNHSIFSEIYKKNIWGGKKGEFFSGRGSHNDHINEYAKTIAEFIRENAISKIVEIGCGDFNVTNKTLSALDEYNYEYVYFGYDVVDDLIRRNKMLFGSSKRNFICKDSCTGRLKNGDLLIVRQVLQHLSNKSIKQIIDKFDNYKHVLITEHQLSKEVENIIPNKDITNGHRTRLTFTSGVYLEEPPFNRKIHSLVYSIPEYSYWVPSAINTYLLNRS